MPKSNQSLASAVAIDILSTLLLSSAEEVSALTPRLLALGEEDFDALLHLAHANHVVVRGFEAYRSLMLAAGNVERAEKCAAVVEAEKERIRLATQYLRQISDGLNTAGLDVTVIKTLDHWPDFGSDIDLYTGADPAAVCRLMQTKFNAVIAERSWGDRLAGKWNFDIPGLPEAVEIHMCRLGQTGEQLQLASFVPARARVLDFDGQPFRVASAVDRIMISTLQRMYRHFYFRLCDILDSASLALSGELDYNHLRTSAQTCGIWEGTATYMVLVSDYVERYSGHGLSLPAFVQASCPLRWFRAAHREAVSSACQSFRSPLGSMARSWQARCGVVKCTAARVWASCHGWPLLRRLATS